MARPSRFTPQIRQQIIDSIREGNFQRHAAAAAGVSESTMRHWMARGRKEDAPKDYRSFVEAVEQAEAEAVSDAVSTIRGASFADWKAAAWFLARKAPDEWGDKAKRSAREAIEEVLRTAEEVLGAEHADKLWRALSERVGGEEGQASPSAGSTLQ